MFAFIFLKLQWTHCNLMADRGLCKLFFMTNDKLTEVMTFVLVGLELNSKKIMAIKIYHYNQSKNPLWHSLEHTTSEWTVILCRLPSLSQIFSWQYYNFQMHLLFTLRLAMEPFPSLLVQLDSLKNIFFPPSFPKWDICQLQTNLNLEAELLLL